MDAAGRHGLQYLCEADLYTMFPSTLGERAAARLAQLGDLLEQERLVADIASGDLQIPATQGMLPIRYRWRKESRATVSGCLRCSRGTGCWRLRNRRKNKDGCGG